MSTLSDGIKDCCDGNGLNAARLRRLFTLFAQDLFSDSDNHDEYSEQLSCFNYNIDAPGEGDLPFTWASRPEHW